MEDKNKKQEIQENKKDHDSKKIESRSDVYDSNIQLGGDAFFTCNRKCVSKKKE